MKKLLAALMLLMPVVALGQVTIYDSNGNLIQAEADPSLKAQKTVDVDRDRTKVLRVPLAFNGGTTVALANGGSDSTDAIDVREYASLKLLFRCHIRSAATSTARIAVQFRELDNGAEDSTSTYAEYMYVNGPMPASRDSVFNGTNGLATRLVTFQGADTVQAGHLVTGSLTAPWSGEFPILFDRAREGPSSGLYAYPNGISISLDNLYGRPVRFDQLSIRVRNLSTATCDCSGLLKGFAVR